MENPSFDYKEFTVTREEAAVLDCAFDAIVYGMGHGRKNYQPASWAVNTQGDHIHHAALHLQTWLMQRDGVERADGHDHLALALTRVALAAACR